MSEETEHRTSNIEHRTSKYFPKEELEGMLCLTVWQPWAWCFFQRGGKDVENRLYPAPAAAIGQRMAIHSGLNKKEYDSARESIKHLHGLAVPSLRDLPLGQILGVVTLVGCSQGSPSPWAAEGQWHWQVRDAMPLKTPVVYRGAQGLFRLHFKDSEQQNLI